MRYVSCFSGIGGLEAEALSPLHFCENDPSAAAVLRKRYPAVDVWGNIETFHPPAADLVAGGWPCQDISIAGKQAGLKGLRSGLLLELLRVANEAEAHTVLAENVAHLLRLRNGEEFRASLAAFHDAGFPIVTWRVLNAREFGLPQHRARLLMVASKHDTLARSLFRPIFTASQAEEMPAHDWAAGFYWTAGVHSINYTRGYVPTIKVGSSVGISSPPAVHYPIGNEGVVRLLSPTEALRLQGFADLSEEDFATAAHAYRAVGNAVAQPMGHWLFEGIREASAKNPPAPTLEKLAPELEGDQAVLALDDHRRAYPKIGLSSSGQVASLRLPSGPLATDLRSFLDTSSAARLSPRASRGLLARLERSGQNCPESLREDLARLSLAEGSEGAIRGVWP